MASVRNLKKDIDLVMSLALSDCFYVLGYNEGVSEEVVTQIAGEIITAHRELRQRAAHPDGKDNPKLVKAYYKKLIQDTLAKANEALEKLSAEVKKTAK